MGVKKKRSLIIFMAGLLLITVFVPALAQETAPQEIPREVWHVDDGADSIRTEGTVNEPAETRTVQDIVTSGCYHYTSDQDYESFPPVYITVVKKVPLKQETSDENQGDTHRRRSLSSRSGASGVKWVRKRVQEDISPVILKCAKAHNISPFIIKAIIEVESSYNPNAISCSGACGLMQLKPSTAYEMGISDYWNYEKNIEAGTRYLRLMLDMFGNLSTALAGYNQGPGAVQRAGNVPPNRSATRYIWKVYKVLERMK